MNQTLFDYRTKLITHKGDSDTSQEAAQKMIETGKLSRQEKQVYKLICEWFYFRKMREFTAKEINSFWCNPTNYYVI